MLHSVVTLKSCNCNGRAGVLRRPADAPVLAGSCQSFQHRRSEWLCTGQRLEQKASLARDIDLIGRARRLRRRTSPSLHQAGTHASWKIS